jgi:hypothetical protein
MSDTALKISGQPKKGVSDKVEDILRSFLLAMKGVSGHFRLCLQGDHLKYYGGHHPRKAGDGLLISGTAGQEEPLKPEMKKH